MSSSPTFLRAASQALRSSPGSTVGQTVQEGRGDPQVPRLLVAEGGLIEWAVFDAYMKAAGMR